MRKLSNLVTDIKKEIRDIPMQNAAMLTVLGFEIQQKIQSMIGTHQIFWKDLADSTVERKAKHHGGKGGDPSSPLYDTGGFEKSIEYKLVGKNKVQIFSEDPTAVYHEMGTSKQPPRPVIKPAAMLVLKKFLSAGTISKFYLKSLR